MRYWIKKLGKVPDEKETQWIPLENPVEIPKPVLISTIGIRVGPYSVEVQNGFSQEPLAQASPVEISYFILNDFINSSANAD